MLNRTVRITLTAVLLAAVGHATAADLYRWVETDGSITYSPKPPPAGVDFDVVDTAAIASQSSANNSPVGASTPLPTTALAVPSAASNASPDVTYAPSPEGQVTGLEAGITAGAQTSAETQELDPAAVAPNSGSTSADITASASKRAQCEELEKRVVSLERRLQSPLTPEDMDNTVLYMARYQQSVDRFCRS